MAIIAVDYLSKIFRVNQKDPGLRGALKALVRPRHVDKPAVAGITFSVEPGEIVGYIGVNGTGKSTTVKMLTGVLVPSGGQVRVLGRDPHRQRVANARDMGAVFENYLFAHYPLTIYPRAIQLMLTWLIPYAFASFYPASFLLGRDVGPLVWISPLVAVVLVVLGYRLWLVGLRRYEGTGSWRIA